MVVVVSWCLCCATKLVGNAKFTGDVHPSEVESADSFDVFLPVAVANGIRRLGAVAVGEEVEKLAGLSSTLPAAVVVADGVQADLSGFRSIGDFDRQDSVWSLSLSTTLNTIYGVSDAVGVESESVGCDENEQDEILGKVHAIYWLIGYRLN
jgi:hypothetical protein